MNRVHRGTLDLAAGRMMALMSRLNRALELTSFWASHANHVTHAAQAAHGAPAPAALDRSPGGPRVLVADDNPSDLGYACELLGRWEVTPTLAANGAEAVALACGGDFDLILMDLQMPVLDGLEATKQIRIYEQQQSRVRTPVLAYTSCVLEQDLLRDCGVDGVLAKPCSASALRECLLRWCAARIGTPLATDALA